MKIGMQNDPHFLTNSFLTFIGIKTEVIYNG